MSRAAGRSGLPGRWTVAAGAGLAVVAWILIGATAAAQELDRARLAAAVDSIVEEALKGGRAAGMSVAVVRGADTIVMKGYGYAELEHKVPTPDRAVYEIGSLTKQFTAAAVLKLEAEGKLSLDDDITKYFPDYPTRGHRIPLRRLLDHTSGIKSYTEMPAFGQLSVMKLPRDTLVKLVSAEPFDFAPGDALVYNNSAYFLLGLVIEKVSGRGYDSYVREHLFEPAGMTDSRYCHERAVVERRAHGYDMTGFGLMRAAYLDHTWPYAAGSLCSTVGDLVAWTRALHGGRILPDAAHRSMITPEPLNSGVRPRYAKGLVVDSIAGRPAISHGGAIHGFQSELAYFPEDTLVIAVLMNTAGPVSPAAVLRSIAEAIYGEAPPVKAAPFTGNADDYVGEYRGVGRGRELVVQIGKGEDGGLTARIGGGRPVPLTYLGNETFDTSRRRITFIRENGRVTGAWVDLISVVSPLERRE